MEIISNIPALRTRLERETSTAFVPTMGNLHEGHLSLVRLARRHGRCVVASIFVNPLQFAPGEDYAKYPRTFSDDCAKLDGLADLVFAPEVGELYPVPQQVFVEPPPLALDLCGAFRPDHFRGVATVVLKFFNIVQPQVAVFGKKDYQQLAVIRALVEQLNLPLRIIAGETTRASDGLALSSRNGFLSSAERTEAVRLQQNLKHLENAAATGNRDFAALEKAARSDLEAYGWRVDYVAVRNAADLAPAKHGDQALVALAAAWLGNTRLIDNIELQLG